MFRTLDVPLSITRDTHPTPHFMTVRVLQALKNSDHFPSTHLPVIMRTVMITRT